VRLTSGGCYRNREIFWNLFSINRRSLKSEF
jgi:hypothetical protein